MGLLSATRSCLRNYATFSGRSRRPEFWWFAALYGLLILICAEGLPRLLTLLGLGSDIVLDAAILSMLATALVLTTPLFAAAARRLHDVETSGLAVLVAPALAVNVLALEPVFRSLGMWGLAIMLDFLGPWVIAASVLWLGAKLARRGSQGPNVFGDEPPLEP